MLVLEIVPKWLTHDADRRNLFRSGKSENMSKPLPLQSAQRPPQLLRLVSNHVRTKLSVWPVLVMFMAELLGEVQHDRNRQNMELTSESDQWLTRLRLDICGVNHREASCGKPLTRHEVQHLERIFRGDLGVLVVRYKPTTEVGGKHLGGLEMCPSKAGLSATRRSDQNNEREFRDRYIHKLKTPICVGAPT